MLFAHPLMSEYEMKCSNRHSYTDRVNSLPELYVLSVSVGCLQRVYCESDVALHNSHDKCGFLCDHHRVYEQKL